MLCNICQLEKSEKDFYVPNVCYKCQYKEKLKTIPKTKLCKVCYAEVKGKRTKYCCDECRIIATKAKKVHWTKKMVNPVVRYWD